jgi:hypothetical protein
MKRIVFQVRNYDCPECGFKFRGTDKMLHQGIRQPGNCCLCNGEEREWDELTPSEQFSIVESYCVVGEVSGADFLSMMSVHQAEDITFQPLSAFYHFIEQDDTLDSFFEQTGVGRIIEVDEPIEFSCPSCSRVYPVQDNVCANCGCGNIQFEPGEEEFDIMTRQYYVCSDCKRVGRVTWKAVAVKNEVLSSLEDIEYRWRTRISVLSDEEVVALNAAATIWFEEACPHEDRQGMIDWIFENDPVLAEGGVFHFLADYFSKK